MQGTKLIRAAHWMITLPADWIGRGETVKSSLYFDSPDTAKGVYLSTWYLNKSKANNSDDAVAWFKPGELATLANDFRTMEDRIYKSDTASNLLIDSFDQAKSYRVVRRIVSISPIVVRATFHDYACEDYDTSKAFFDPIIDSLHLIDAKPSFFAKLAQLIKREPKPRIV